MAQNFQKLKLYAFSLEDLPIPVGMGILLKNLDVLFLN